MKLKPVRSLLAKLCFIHGVGFFGSIDCHGQQASNPAPVQRKEAGRLPRVPTVESMLRPDASVERFLSRTPTESAYEKASQFTDSRVRKTNDEIEQGKISAGWTSPAFYTRPLYFEQINFERYETSAPAWTRPIVSYAQFLGTIPVLPYKMSANGPRDRNYTVGHYPYGQVAPSHSNWGKPSTGFRSTGSIQ